MCGGWLWLRPLLTTKPDDLHEHGPTTILLLILLLLLLAMMMVAWATCMPSETAAVMRTITLANDLKAGLYFRLVRRGAAILGQVLSPELCVQRQGWRRTCESVSLSIVFE